MYLYASFWYLHSWQKMNITNTMWPTYKYTSSVRLVSLYSCAEKNNCIFSLLLTLVNLIPEISCFQYNYELCINNLELASFTLACLLSMVLSTSCFSFFSSKVTGMFLIHSLVVDTNMLGFFNFCLFICST